MKTWMVGSAIAVMLLLTPSFSSAMSITYTGALLGSNEVPVANTTGQGNATVTLDTVAVTLRVQATFSGLIGNTAAVFVHCCTSPGSTAGIATQLPSFPGFPLGVNAGTYDHTFDMSLVTSYNPSFITSHGGTAGSAFNALVAGLNSGDAYFNIHTNAFLPGELRANLAPVPEPGSLGLLLLGLGALGLTRAVQSKS